MIYHTNDLDEILTLLNQLGILYNSYFGFHPCKSNTDQMDEIFISVHKNDLLQRLEWYKNECFALISDENGNEITDLEQIKQNIQKYQKKLTNIKKTNIERDNDEDIDDKNINDNNDTENSDQDDEIDEFNIVCDLNSVMNLSYSTIPHKKVIIQYSDKNYWERLPTEWYNRPSNWWKNIGKINEYLLSYVLPYFNTCDRYIKVIEPFMKIEISAENKGTRININDIFFATRGLMADDTRTVDSGYKVIANDGITLVLEPEIDNWST